MTVRLHDDSAVVAKMHMSDCSVPWRVPFTTMLHVRKQQCTHVHTTPCLHVIGVRWLTDGRSRSEMFVRLRPDFSAAAAKTHVSDSAVPWRNHPTTYDQVQPMQRDHNTMLIACAISLTPCRSESSASPAILPAPCIISVATEIGYK